MAQIRFSIFSIYPSDSISSTGEKSASLFIFNIDGSISRKQHSVAGVTGWHHTIKHITPTLCFQC
jgi:hypothetical protein